MFMSQARVAEQQGAFSQLGGAVFRDASFGFMPAFKDSHTNETHLSVYRTGELAVIHILDGLPNYWVAEWGEDGRPTSLKAGIIAGFVRYGEFFTLSEISNELRDA